MKRVMTLWLAIGCMLFANTAFAENDKDIKAEARFLTDKIAYEMKLNKEQLADAYEINYDFLKAAYPLMESIAEGNEQAVTQYYIYLDIRNADMVWVVGGKLYNRYMEIVSLFRPLYLKDGHAHLRVHDVYGKKKNYLKKPKSMGKYKGEHSRFNQGGKSYYKGRHRIVAYGGQPRLLHDRNKKRLAQARSADFGK